MVEDDRLQNVIYNRRIWSRSWGWTAREYTGSNPHDKHAHFSSRYTTAAESNTRPWGLLAAEEAEQEAEDDGMANMTQDEFDTRMDAWWNSRMNSGQADPESELNYLRRAPWNLVISGTDTMYARQARIEAASTRAANGVAALADAFAAWVVAEERDDAEVAAKLVEVRAAVDELRADLPQETGPAS